MHFSALVIPAHAQLAGWSTFSIHRLLLRKLVRPSGFKGQLCRPRPALSPPPTSCRSYDVRVALQDFQCYSQPRGHSTPLQGRHPHTDLQGKGKDPLVPASYRGITLTSVIAKSFEILLLDRMLPILIDRNIPQLTQRAYQRGVSCADATFTCQETISKFIRDGDSVYSCFYDLASAFDTVEYLKNSGITGKTWLAPHQRLVRRCALTCMCGKSDILSHLHQPGCSWPKCLWSRPWRLLTHR